MTKLRQAFALTIILCTMSLTACNALEDLDQVEADALAELRTEASPECAIYCDKAQEFCTAGNTLFSSQAQCFSTCATYPKGGLENDFVGDTVQCRVYHLTLAASSDPNTHCPHASQGGGGMCEGPAPCGEYCGLFLEGCNRTTQDYAGLDECLMTCDAFAQNGRGAMATDDTVQCRLEHLRNLGQNTEERCEEAGPDGCLKFQP